MILIADDDDSDSFKFLSQNEQFVDLETFSELEDSSWSVPTLETASKSEKMVSSQSLNGDEAAGVDNTKDLNAFCFKEYSQKANSASKSLQKYAFTKIWVEQQQNNYLNNLTDEYKFTKALDDYFHEENTNTFSINTTDLSDEPLLKCLKKSD